MAEEFLNVPEIGALIEQVRRKRMPQRVWRDVVNIGALFDVLINHPAYAPSRDPRTLIVQKNGLVVTLYGRAVIEKRRARCRQIMH